MASIGFGNNQRGLFIIVGLIVAVVAAFALFGADESADNEAMISDGPNVAADSQDQKAPADTKAISQQPQAQPTTPAPAPAPAPPQNSAGLAGSTFYLSSYNGHIVQGGSSYTVRFTAGNQTFEDGFITATFCSTLTSPYRINKNVINGELSGARKYCPEPKDAMDLEGAFVQLIDGGSQITLQGNALTLTDNVRTMVFIR